MGSVGAEPTTVTFSGGIVSVSIPAKLNTALTHS